MQATPLEGWQVKILEFKSLYNLNTEIAMNKLISILPISVWNYFNTWNVKRGIQNLFDKKTARKGISKKIFPHLS